MLITRRLIRAIFIAALFSALPVSSGANDDNDSLLLLATTTSTANSGLLDYLLPEFEKDSSIRVHYIAVGTGKALRLGKDGDVDVVLVHARSAEQKFVDSGFGVERFDVMYNDFVLVGPPTDPAKIASSQSVFEALDKIRKSQNTFISRGDDSGTHKKELSLWKGIDYSPEGDWYKEVGQGMGKVIQIANELGAYTMTDRGTWLAYRSKSNLALLYHGDQPLFNPYGIIAVNPWRHSHVNYSGAQSLIRWLTSSKGQQLIAEFKVQGEQLFIPLSGQGGP
ncbi:MAG: substrate-binding domain-containing protein [Proteobacteria bacterium]|nr:substrate-binding domain-containing protein [Pseudomonadota bacterium]